MLRDYQHKLGAQAAEILNRLNIVYLAIQMRVGKTLISLKAAELVNVKSVLFVTKKKAIRSIEGDYRNAGFKYSLTVINYESLHKIDGNGYDLIIVDEAHCIAAFPKPSKRTKQLKKIVGDKKLILLSGTPTPESDSQIYHQFWISTYSPFEAKTFYKWAREYVDVQQKLINGYYINIYHKAKTDVIKPLIEPYMITYTQKQAGFKQTEIDEQVIYVKPDERILQLMKLLVKERYYKFTKLPGEIVCDTAAKLQSKLHQISSGTVKTEKGDYYILDKSKAEYIDKNYPGKRIAIFYKFIAEGNALRAVLDNVTDVPEEFNNNPDKIFISQIQSGAMGVDLSAADILIYYNIDFSATNYWQSRERLQKLNRDKPPVIHWLFTQGGLEDKVLTAVQKKRDYTLKYFRRDYLNGKRYSETDNTTIRTSRGLRQQVHSQQ